MKRGRIMQANPVMLEHEPGYDENKDIGLN